MTIARGAALGSTSAGGFEPARLADDLAFAAEIGLDMVRIDVSWVLGQPRAGVVHGAYFEDLVSAAQEAHRIGLRPWFRLLQPQVPHWFDDDGGFTDEGTAGTWWPRWVESVADHLGDVAAGWVPLEAPHHIVTRLEPDDLRRQGETMHTLVVAWRDAWRILRGGPPVATSLDAGSWDVWLDGLHDGVVRIRGRGDRPVADLAGACDVVGLAVHDGVESALHRAAEVGPPRPLALTIRPLGDTDSEQADSITVMWRQARDAASSLEITSVTAAALLDSPGRSGLATADRRLKDSGEAFVAG